MPVNAVRVWLQALYSTISFAAVRPLLPLGRTRCLEPQDALPLPRQLRVTTGAAELLERMGRGETAQTALTKILYGPLLVALWWRLVSEAASACTPLLIQQCIRAAQGEAAWTSNPLLLALALFGSSILQFTALNTFTYYCFSSGLQARAIIGAAVCSRSLQLSCASRASRGTVMQLVSKDADGVERFFIFCHNLWSAPLTALITSLLLYYMLGYATLIGLLVTLVAIPLEVAIVRWTKRVQRRTVHHTDARLGDLLNAFQGIRYIKIAALEDWLVQTIAKGRDLEMAQVTISAFIKALNLFVVAITPMVVAVLTFWCAHTWGKVTLTADTVFPALALFGTLGRPFKIWPKAIGLFTSFLVTCQRLDKFMGQRTADPLPATMTRKASVASPLVHLQHATVKHGPEVSAPVIVDVNLRLAGPQLVALTGAVGAGKTSLLLGLTGELTVEPLDAVQLHGNVGWCPQIPWIINATVRDNIIMDLPYDPDHFADVIFRCCLQDDLSELPGGELCELGERGLTLSGGQRQRVSLARALYADCSVYLLDDVFSALDSVVAEHVFQHAVQHVAKNSLCIMVCNDRQFLARAARIFEVFNGTLRETHDWAQDLSPGAGIAAGTVIGVAVESRQQDKRNDIAGQEEAKGRLTDLDKQSQPPPQGPAAVGWHVYIVYAQSCGLVLALLVVLSAALAQVLSAIKDYQLSHDVVESSHLTLYAAYAAGAILSVACRMLFLTKMGIRASRALHARLATQALAAPLAYFHQNPVGRLLTLFSSDMETLDNSIVRTMGSWAESMLTVISTVGVVLFLLPVTIFGLGPLALIYWWTCEKYMPASRQLRRLKTSTQAPLFSHLAETLDGVASIRIGQLGGWFQAKCEAVVDVNSSVSHTAVCLNRWLSFRLDVIGGLLVFFVALAAISYAPWAGSGAVGLMLAYAVKVTATLSLGVRSSSSLENDLGAVERIIHFLDTTPTEKTEGFACPVDWPSSGQVTFKNVTVRYRPDLAPAIEAISFSVRPGEHIGIVGRTGAGKSTLVNSIFRLVELAEGSIIIDGQDIADLDLRDLRARIAMVSQEPTLFFGTVRASLDPRHRFEDAVLIQALATVGLREEVRLSSEADSLSTGERQLCCLARAFLTRSRFLVLDEATSSVDPRLDRVLQRTLATRFRGCSMLKIAHRLEDVIMCHRVLVMARGRVIESGTPAQLLTDPTSNFACMVAELGPDRAAHIRAAATAGSKAPATSSP